MNRSLTILLILALSSTVLSTIRDKSTKGFPDSIPLADQDILEINSNMIFDMSVADFGSTVIDVQQGNSNNYTPVNNVVKGGGGGVAHYKYTDAFDSVGEINNTIFISNSTYLVIHDNSDFILFKTNSHTSEIGVVWRVDLQVSGQTLVCQDATSGSGQGYENIIYVLCKVTTINTGVVSLEIYAFDKSNGYQYPPAIQEVGNKFKIENKLEIGFYYLNVNSAGRTASKPFLVTYDQGRNVVAPQTAGDKYVRLWALVSATNVDFEADVKVSLDKGRTITTLYDAFAWNGQMILSSVNSDKSDQLILTSCDIDEGIQNLTCSVQDTDHTADVSGYIGLGHTNA